MLGRTIFEARGEMGQVEFADRVRALMPGRKLDRSTFSYIENGTYNAPIDLLVAIGKVLRHQLLLVPIASADAIASRVRELDHATRELIVDVFALVGDFGSAAVLRSLRPFVRALREELTQARAATPVAVEPLPDEAVDRR